MPSIDEAKALTERTTLDEEHLLSTLFATTIIGEERIPINLTIHIVRLLL